MKQSAGILLYQFVNRELRVLLVHPGGPYWAKKDLGAWTIPKGEFTEGETALQAAQREFEEETGQPVAGTFTELTPISQKGGKQVFAWAVEGRFDVTQLKSNLFDIPWPPGSGLVKSFPEIDRASWFTVREALQKILPAQQAFIMQLQELVSEGR